MKGEEQRRQRVSDIRVLIVEDEPDQRRLLADILRSEGYLATEAEDCASARTQLQATAVDLVLSDWKLPDGDGMELLLEVQSHWPRTAFVMITAYGTISRAVEAVRRGADDFLPKPFERQALLLALERTLKARRLEAENRRLSEELQERDRLVDLVGSAPSMQRLFRRVEKIAGTQATVLLAGESGTGKELAARALHALSSRARGPFVAVNCAAIPEGLMEAEFFGAEKGAFTGADRVRVGKFEAAHLGTLFLDEVGELPLEIQPKLLRALQEGTVTRVGGNRELAVDVRILAATNRDLEAEVAASRFREDLYYRLNVVPIPLPPLRDRREDIPRLVEHFVQRAARRHGVQPARFPPALLRRLIDYTWPGNVRELANVVERLLLLADDDLVQAEDLPPSFDGPNGGGSAEDSAQNDGGFRLPPGGLSWEALECSCLQQALELAGGNRARAARLLDLPYKAFLYRLEKHGLAAS